MERKKLRMAGLILAVLPVQTVSMKYGYDLRAETYADDPRFTFCAAWGVDTISSRRMTRS